MTMAQALEKKGIEKGALETKKKSALNLLEIGLDEFAISKALEFPIEEIRKLKNEIKH